MTPETPVPNWVVLAIIQGAHHAYRIRNRKDDRNSDSPNIDIEETSWVILETPHGEMQIDTQPVSKIQVSSDGIDILYN